MDGRRRFAIIIIISRDGVVKHLQERTHKLIITSN